MIGSEGQVGSELRDLLTSSVQIRKSRAEVIFSGRSVLDLTDTPSISNYLNHVAPTIIVNASAYTAVDKAESQSDLAFLVNHVAVREMAMYCNHNECPLIHISTDYVFDGEGDSAYVETDATGPCSVYGASKLAGENSIRELLDPHIILRTSWVFGVSGNNFVKTMVRLADIKSELGVVGDQFGAPTSARGIAKVIGSFIDAILCSARDDTFWGTYHYSGSPFVSWAEFAVEIFGQSEMLRLIDRSPVVNPISTADYPTLATRPANSRLDCSKLENRFSIKPDDWKQSLGVMLSKLKEERVT